MLDKLEIAFYGIYIKIFSVILLFGILFAYTLPGSVKIPIVANILG